MLALSRKPGQCIRLEIGGILVRVHVVRCDRGLVRLGFEAPPSVIILRDELQTTPARKEIPW